MTDVREDTPESGDSLSGRIDSLAESGAAFALYRFPYAGEPVLAIQTTEPVACLHRLEELNGQTGFVFAPFEITRERPVVLLKPDVRAAGTEKIASLLGHLASLRPPGQKRQPAGLSAGRSNSINGPGPLTPPGEETIYTAYTCAFRSFAAALKQKEFEKLVLSRPRIQEKNRRFSAAQVFFEACRRYPAAFVYLFHTPPTGTWLGSTPETLLADEGGRWHTVALAGTRKREDGNGFSSFPPFTGTPVNKMQGAEPDGMRRIAPEKNQKAAACADALAGWDVKNRREQELVARYLRELLLARGIPWEEKGPYPCRAGKVTHLLTDFYFHLPAAGRLGDLVAALHPTPAVCGLPKEKALRFICRNEGYDRAYYSGFAGWMSPAGGTGLYVNLRCMQVGADRLTLYAGGGLLPSSELAIEWKETEDKLQTLLDLIDRPAALRNTASPVPVPGRAVSW